jgi:hypothetical protein
VAKVETLPIGEYDEWYVFESQRVLPELHVFVNYLDFTPSPAPLAEADPTWDRLAAEEALRYTRERAESFWRQLLSIRPKTFLAEGETLTCVTNDERLVPNVLAAIGGAPQPDLS